MLSYFFYYCRIADEENNEENEIDSNSISIANPVYDGNQSDSSINGISVHLDNVNQNDEFNSHGLWVGSKEEDLVFGFSYVLQQLKILFKKRLIHSLRNKLLIIFQIIIPIAVLIINLIYIKYGPIKASDSPPLEMDIKRYSKNFIPYQLKNQISSDDLDIHQLIKLYSDQFNLTTNTKSFELSQNNTVNLCMSSRDNIDDFLRCVGRISINFIVDNYLLATEFEQNKNQIGILAHFNNQPYHTPSLAVNLVSNSLLNYFTNSSDKKITVLNHPLPRNVKEKIQDLQFKDVTGFNIATGLTFGFSFLIASFSMFLIKERSSDSKHLQFLNGCSSYLYWISALIWDVFNYMIPIGFILILLKAFGIDEFVGGIRWTYVLECLLMYGFAHIPQTYILSYFFKVSATGFASLVAWNIISSQTSLIAVQILALPQLDLVDISKTLEWIFLLIFPNYSFGQALIDLYNNYQITKICVESQLDQVCDFQPNPCCIHYDNKPTRCGTNSTDDCFLWNKDYMAWEKPGLQRFYVFMPLQFLIQFGLLLLFEAGYFRLINYKIKSLLGFKSEPPNHIVKDQLALEEQFGDIQKDSDVIEEEERIYKLANEAVTNNVPTNEIFVVDRLTKYYSNFMAVKGISFSVKKSESFGLLGVNGAGKTTTFKMITGDEMITKGDAYLNSINIKDDIKMFQRQLGYCPQFDPLIDQMTVYETMEMFANLRGIKPELVKKTCLSLISLLDLNDHIHKMCYALSGGNKRKLSVAIALVGSPIIILLDEPTS